MNHLDVTSSIISQIVSFLSTEVLCSGFKDYLYCDSYARENAKNQVTLVKSVVHEQWKYFKTRKARCCKLGYLLLKEVTFLHTKLLFYVSNCLY
ncbi:hypothetical protein BZG32_10760 [Enterococcus faecalis]|uniref:Uncharacterized protein n=1 Tax=Enterococcus faecalis TaxID=1351 RepID=A0A1Q1FVL7_ENTFL|nr:hypothetical protein BZG32_10760 [Enterococcus faecalis]AXG88973.1 hypothetical protein DTO64_10555 [Enterococcus faecalis]MBO6399954.1 hypothetical protein [Enterococcus faecalis]OSM32292.1 hypothetical protein B6S43_03060 [Enterococcus faecalis]PCP68779.1 hypothetical protein CQA23_13300 [Enterococcus faecalis]